MRNYGKDNNSEKEKARKRIIKIIIIIIIILLLLTCCVSGLFGRIGDKIRDHSRYEIENGQQTPRIIYDENLKFTTNTGSALIDDVYRIEFETGELGTKDFMCTTSDSNIATCLTKDGYVEVYPKSIGDVEIHVIAEGNGYKYIGRHYLKILDVERFIKLKKDSGTIYLNKNKKLMVAIEMFNLTGDIQVSSSNEEVAIAEVVNNTLIITGKATGKAKIVLYLYYNGNEYKAYFDVTVTKKKDSGNNNNKPDDDNNNNDNEEKASDENRLSLIEFDNLTLKPKFDKDKYSYTIDAPDKISKTKLTIKKMDNKEKIHYYLNGVEINDINNLPLKYGKNKVVIKVISESGKVIDYTIVITRKHDGKPDDDNKDNEEKKSNENRLASIIFDKLTLKPKFDKDRYSYTIDAPDAVDKTKLTIKKIEDKEKVHYYLNGKEITDINNISLKYGENKVVIKVISESGKIVDYTIIITRNKDNKPDDEIKPSNENRLSSIKFDNLDLKPAFDKDKYSYTIDAPDKISKTKLTIKKMEDKEKVHYYLNGAEIDDINNIPLKYGKNKVVIKVISESGKVADYTVIITRKHDDNPDDDNKDNEEKKSNENRLALIEFENLKLKPTFNKDKYSYTIDAPDAIAKTKLTIKKIEDKEKVHYYLNGKEITDINNIPLKYGENKVGIKVISESGKEANYTIIITRTKDEDQGDDNNDDEKQKSNENRLASIVFDKLDLKPKFDKDTYSYTIDAPDKISKTKLTIKKLHDKETVKYYLDGEEIKDLNNIPLKYGKNKVVIKVISESGKKIANYNIIITRTKDEKPEDPEDKSNDSYLSLLEIEGGHSLNPVFKKDVFEYTSEVEYDVSILTLKYLLSDNKAKVKLFYNGTEVNSLKDLNIKVGSDNIVKIVVTAEDGTESTYKVVITRNDKVPDPDVQKSDDNYLKSLSVSDGVLDPKFDKNKTSYKVIVDPYTKKITVSSKKNDSKANVTYYYKGNKVDNLKDLNLAIGNNNVVIRVTAENGDVKDYSVLIQRNDYENEYKLNSIEISDRDFKEDFDPNVNDYNIRVDSKLDSISITAKKESKKASIKYYFENQEVDNLKDLELHGGNNIVRIIVTSEKGIYNPEAGVKTDNEYIITIYKPYVSIDFEDEEITFYMEDLVDGKYNFIYNVYEDGISIENYDVNKIHVTIPGFNGKYNLNKGYIEIIPKNSDVLNSYTIKIEYLGHEDSLKFNIKMKDYYINISSDKYYIDSIDGEGHRSLILNTNIFDKDINPEEKGNDLILKNNKGYIEIKSNGVKVRFNADDNKNITDYITFIVSALKSGTYDLTIDAYVYGKHIDSKTVKIIVTAKYSVVIDAGDGFYNSFTTKYEYVLEEGKVITLDEDTYMAYKKSEDCTFYKLDKYTDKDGNEYHIGDTIVVEKSLYLTANYTSETYDIDVDDGGTMYLTEVDIFHNEEYYQKYHKDKIIYPGANGSHVMTISNNTTGTVKITQFNIEEDTYCTSAGCINMAYIVKYIRPDEDHDMFYYGAENSYTILNKDVSSSDKKYNSATGTYEIRKEISLGSDGIEVAPGESIEIALLWKWDDSDDAADTSIGELGYDTNYAITVSIDYSIVNNVCAING